mmetsp:Transcript_2949/g.8082  ORF Transcript_2949/g.8082 Transcript_2949/m.8082 type:complete len:201 (-) Transcript_2949:250-852(-)
MSQSKSIPFHSIHTLDSQGLVLLGRNLLHHWLQRRNDERQSHRLQHLIQHQRQPNLAQIRIHLGRQIPSRLAIRPSDPLHRIQPAEIDREVHADARHAPHGPVVRKQRHAVIPQKRLVLAAPCVQLSRLDATQHLQAGDLAIQTAQLGVLVFGRQLRDALLFGLLFVRCHRGVKASRGRRRCRWKMMRQAIGVTNIVLSP